MRKLCLTIVLVFTCFNLAQAINPNGITGNFSICLPGPLTTQLTGSGTPASVNPWTSSNTAIATVNNSGLVTATGALGATTITYNDNLGNSYAQNVYVSTYPTISSPSGNYLTCAGGVFQLNGSLFPHPNTPWQSSNTAIATVDNTGLVTGVSAGTCTITYMNLGGCTATRTITINPLLSPTIDCGSWANNSRTFSWNAVSGATTYTIVYTINSGSFVFGATGNVLAFTVNNVLETDLVNLYVTPSGPVGSCFTTGVSCQSVVPCPEAGILTGNQNICVGSTTSFTSTEIGGTWSSSNNAIATVNPTTGVITGVSAGTAIMTYTVVGIAPCPDAIATRMVTVNAQPEQPSLQGFQGICVGSWTIFTADPPGGTWSSSNNAVAMVDSTGFILGNSAGVCTISYTISGSGGCSDRIATRNVAVSTTPTIVLASAPNTANQTVCENTPITPIVYNIGAFNAQDAMVINLPAGVSGAYSAGVLTISGTPAVSGTFPYSAVAVGPCGSDSLSGTITVNPSVSTTMFCDPSGVTLPNSVRIDWANIVGVTTYEYAYSIDNGPVVTGTTNISNYEILEVQPGQSVIFTLTDAVGVSCFQPISVTCSNLANESFEIDTFQSFPNPVTDILKIISAAEISQLEITNALGERILQKEFASKTVEVDMSGMAAGIYLVKLSANHAVKTFKVIKQ